MGGSLIFNHGTSNSARVAVALGKELEAKVESVHRLHEGRSLIIKMVVNEKKLVVINVYAPNEDNVLFFQDIFEFIENCEYDHILIGGDFNKVLDPQMDRKSFRSSGYSLSKTALFLNTYMEENLWVDIWRNLHPNDQQFTWHRR